MSARGTFRFSEFTLRPAGAIATDALLAKQWTEADPWHNTVQPSFWIEQGQHCDSYILYDKDGPVFFWKGVLISPRSMEMHIQFPPRPANAQERRRLRGRVALGLIVGLKWLEGILFATGVKEIYFDSFSDDLIVFCVNRLDFVQDGPLLRKRLSASRESQKLVERQM